MFRNLWRIIHDSMNETSRIQKIPKKLLKCTGIIVDKMYNARLMVTCSGSLATISCELRQVRKEATVAVISGAEVWLGQVTT